ncbi:MAG: hypothetical protein CM1200mP28_01140 [Deltaproteobacteria bacterium]|nr:MAG: hypothetical protein CM1200mP28_01140 [Deltaproteobacteria bacterium]
MRNLEGAIEEFEKNSVYHESKKPEVTVFQWLASFIERKDCDEVLGTISEWKKVVFPRMSPPFLGCEILFFRIVAFIICCTTEQGALSGKKNTT